MASPVSGSLLAVFPYADNKLSTATQPTEELTDREVIGNKLYDALKSHASSEQILSDLNELIYSIKNPLRYARVQKEILTIALKFQNPKETIAAIFLAGCQPDLGSLTEAVEFKNSKEVIQLIYQKAGRPILSDHILCKAIAGSCSDETIAYLIELGAPCTAKCLEVMYKVNVPLETARFLKKAYQAYLDALYQRIKKDEEENTNRLTSGSGNFS